MGRCSGEAVLLACREKVDCVTVCDKHGEIDGSCCHQSSRRWNVWHGNYILMLASGVHDAVHDAAARALVSGYAVVLAGSGPHHSLYLHSLGPSQTGC